MSGSAASGVDSRGRTHGFKGARHSLRGDVYIGRGDRTGGASRFFYCSKAGKEERGGGNNHATVKPLALCQWLCRLVSSPGDTIFDPFQGSGTTGLAALSLGRRYVGIEKEPDYHAIAVRRLKESAGPLFADPDGTVEIDSRPLTAGRDRA